MYDTVQVDPFDVSDDDNNDNDWWCEWKLPNLIPYFVGCTQTILHLFGRFYCMITSIHLLKLKPPSKKPSFQWWWGDFRHFRQFFILNLSIFNLNPVLTENIWNSCCSTKAAFAHTHTNKQWTDENKRILLTVCDRFSSFFVVVINKYTNSKNERMCTAFFLLHRMRKCLLSVELLIYISTSTELTKLKCCEYLLRPVLILFR